MTAHNSEYPSWFQINFRFAMCICKGDIFTHSGGQHYRIQKVHLLMWFCSRQSSLVSLRGWWGIMKQLLWYHQWFLACGYKSISAYTCIWYGTIDDHAQNSADLLRTLSWTLPHYNWLAGNGYIVHKFQPLFDNYWGRNSPEPVNTNIVKMWSGCGLKGKRLIPQSIHYL